MSTSGQQPVIQTQTSTPWSGAQPFLTQAMQQASNLWAGDTGYTPYSGETVAPSDPTTLQGLYTQYNIASAEPYGSADLNAARNLGLSLLQSNGLSNSQRALTDQMQGQLGQFGRLYSSAGNLYNQLSGQQNPYLQAEIAASNRQIADKVNAGMSGAGRYGSGAYSDVMARAMSEAANPILAQDYQQRMQQALGALGAQQAAATGGQNVLQNVGNILAGGQDVAGKWAQLVPTLDTARYQPAQMLQSYGQYFGDRAQQELNNAIQLYNAQQAYPWEQLQRYQGILSGTGALGGTRVTSTTPAQPSLLQSTFGGALAGGGLGSMFGPIGTGVGALGGGLLGLLR